MEVSAALESYSTHHHHNYYRAYFSPLMHSYMSQCIWGLMYLYLSSITEECAINPVLCCLLVTINKIVVMFTKSGSNDIMSKPACPPLNLGKTLSRNSITTWSGLTCHLKWTGKPEINFFKDKEFTDFSLSFFGCRNEEPAEPRNWVQEKTSRCSKGR